MNISENTILLQEILEKINTPVLLVRALYNESNSISDFKCVYVNSQFNEQSNSFAEPDIKLSEISNSFPQGFNLYVLAYNVMSSGEKQEFEYLSARVHVWFKVTVERVQNDYCLFMLHNISPLKIKDRYIEYLEQYDVETNLHNGNAFYRIVNNLICEAKKQNRKIALFLMNIDNLSIMNLYSGRNAGNIIVQKCAEALSEFEDENTNIFRLKGDEFGVLKSDCDNEEAALKFAWKIQERIKKVGVTVSVGISLLAPEQNISDDLPKKADLALHFAKKNKRGLCYIYNEDLKNQFLEMIDFRKKINATIRENNLYLLFQPQLYLEGKKIRGFEVSVNSSDETTGNEILLTPATVVEKSDLRVQMEQWILETSFANIKSFENENGFTGTLSIEISSSQFYSKNFISSFSGLLKNYELDGNCIELIVPEHVVSKYIISAVAIINRLKLCNVKICISDFGSNPAFFQHLDNLSIDSLKISKNFLDKIREGSEMEIEIISSVMPYLKQNKIELLAENINSIDELPVLIDIDCSAVQGDFYSKPLNVSQCRTFLYNKK